MCVHGTGQCACNLGYRGDVCDVCGSELIMQAGVCQPDPSTIAKTSQHRARRARGAFIGTVLLPHVLVLKVHSESPKHPLCS
jgi:predicted nucleic acid-binding Zn ribbon protein